MPAFGKVVGRLVTLVIDKNDPDQTPDLLPLAGKVTFTLNVPRVTELDAAPVPMVIASTPIAGVLDANGYLSTPAVTGQPEYQGLWLPANDDPDLNPTQTQYMVSYSLTVAGTNTQVTIPSHLLFLPSNGTVDLATMVPPVDAPPMTIAQAEALLALAVRTVNGVEPDADGNVEVQAGPGGDITWDDVDEKPTSFPPAAHNHSMAEITNLTSALTAKASNAQLDAVVLEFDTFAEETELEIATKADQAVVDGVSDAVADLAGDLNNVFGIASTADTRAQAAQVSASSGISKGDAAQVTADQAKAKADTAVQPADLLVKGVITEGETPTGPNGFYIVRPA